MTIATSHRDNIEIGSSAVLRVLSLSVHAKPKYHLRAGKEYLHMSGLMLTRDRCWEWVGNIDQARTARKRFPAAAGCKARPVTALPMHMEMEE